jgi:hypothetical protein
MTETEEERISLEKTLLEEKQKEELGLSLNDLLKSYTEHQGDEPFINNNLFVDFQKKMEIIWNKVYTKHQIEFEKCENPECFIDTFFVQCKHFYQTDGDFNGGISIIHFITKMYSFQKEYIDDFLKTKFNNNKSPEIDKPPEIGGSRKIRKRMSKRNKKPKRKSKSKSIKRKKY